MKRFLVLLYLILCPCTVFAENVQIDTYLIEANNSNNYLNIQINLPQDMYTYSPEYSAYPSKLNLFNTVDNENIIIYYPKIEESYDYLTNSQLELFSNKINYYIEIDLNEVNKNEDNSLLVSFLLCSKTNCTPYKKEIDISKTLNTPAIYDNDIISILKKDFIRQEFSNASKSLTEDAFTKNKEIEFNFIPRIHDNSLEAVNFLLALFFGLLAGLILNLMPCVLPVIAIKFASLLQAVNTNSLEKQSLIKEYSIFYALGILTFFAILAVLVGYFDLFWGQIFQNTYFIMVLSGLLFMFALALFNVFSFPFINFYTKNKKHSKFDAYLQGLFATIIATPCSGPLLGGVLAFSLTLPLYLLISIFIATGFGMALPYFVLALFPNLINFIPKSGKWSEQLEKIIGYIFLILCLYLLSMLPNNLVYKAIIYLFFVFFFISIYKYMANKKYHILYAIILFIIHSFCSYTLLSIHEDKDDDLWKNFSYEEFQNDLTNEIILLNFTADWCATCKFIEATSLQNSNLEKLINKHNVKLIEVDMTNENILQKELLKSLDSISIPLLAIFPEGIQAYSPIILRDVFTYKQIDSILYSLEN